MTYAGFFVHLNDIPPVLRWLQWLCPLKYSLEALSVNEVGSGLMIEDTLEGVPVNVSAALIMQTVSSSPPSSRSVGGADVCRSCSCLGLGRIITIETCWCCSRSSPASGWGSYSSCGRRCARGGSWTSCVWTL